MPACKHLSLSPITIQRNQSLVEMWEGEIDGEIRTGMRSQRDDRNWIQAMRSLIRPNQFRSLHTTHERHRHIHLHIHNPPQIKPKKGVKKRKKEANARTKKRTRMISNGLFLWILALKASTAKDPFSAISTWCPYFSKILTANFWFTKLSSAIKISYGISFSATTGVTVLDSKALIKADARSAAVTGVVTWEEIELSKHHLTGGKNINGLD